MCQPPARRRRALLSALVLALPGAAACRRSASAPPAFAPDAGAPAATAESAAAATTGAAPGGAVVGRWRGVLPCTGCAGLHTELELLAGPGGISGTYRLVELRRGAPVAESRRESAGDWLAQRGAAHDPEATVYRLEPEDGGEARLWLAVGDDLEALDREGRRVATGADRRLHLLAPATEAGR